MNGQSAATVENDSGNSYDEIPYAVLSHYFTHPDRLATVGTLFGLEPPSIESCRVLELGCASGGNLIPMAYALPRSQFVGIDLSPAQIEQGQKYIRTLKLSNISLVCQDLLDFSPDQAPFDYILVHGVFSWIPPLAQEKVFEICRQCLSGNGVAYVSYNVLPGWKMEQALREMMLFHIRQESQPLERFQKAVELLDFLDKDPSTAGDEIYREHLRKTVRRMRKHADGNYQYWIHEYLEEFNTPFYFSKVVEMAGRHALQYLADSDLPTMYTNDLSEESCRFLEDHAHNWVEREQYLDFLRNRMFRRSLFCRQEAALTRQPGLEQLRRLNVVNRLLPIDREISTADDTPMVFEVTKEALLTFHDPIQKTALVYLAEQLPRSVPFDELAQATLARLGNPSDKLYGAGEIARVLFMIHTFYPSLINFTTWIPPSIFEVSQRPTASATARLLAATGSPITNLIHRRVEMEEHSRYLLWCLNGERSQVELVDMLETAWRAGKIPLPYLKPGSDPQTIRETIARQVAFQLEDFAKLNLLVA
jgi:methyltransferase-like protein/cyclopropane fatty-acyl-phospholipid synthase-like methyltransferase